MAKEPVKVEIIDEADERFIVRTYADGTTERHPVVKLPRKKRYPPRPYRNWQLNKTRKKGF